MRPWSRHSCPSTLGAAPTAVAYNRYTYGLAVFHARTRAHVSARGIAHCLKVSVPQAEAMITEMAGKGLVKPVFGATGGQVRAVSNILRPDAWGLDRAARQARSTQRRERLKTQQDASDPSGVDLGRLMAHLRQLCLDNGMSLHPRCLAQQGAAA